MCLDIISLNREVTDILRRHQTGERTAWPHTSLVTDRGQTSQPVRPKLTYLLLSGDPINGRYVRSSLSCFLTYL